MNNIYELIKAKRIKRLLAKIVNEFFQCNIHMSEYYNHILYDFKPNDKSQWIVVFNEDPIFDVNFKDEESYLENKETYDQLYRNITELYIVVFGA